MRAIAGFSIGIVAAAGVWIAIVGYRGTVVNEDPARRVLRWDDLWWRGGLVLTALIAGWAISGWPAAGAIAAGCAGIAPMLSGTRRRRRESDARSEAIASWAEMLR